MSISYKDKIKELRSGAQETQAAIKIRDKLIELRSKDVKISSYRWIWELIQNAKDCPNHSGKIDIEINFDSVNRIVVFKHNGKLFSTKNIVYLIEQVSTKDRTKDSQSTGKFGTGFLTTNLLSPIVQISGLIDDEDDTAIAQFEVTIDRSGDTIDDLKASIKNSCEQLEANTNPISYDISETDMNTEFKYMLDDNGIQAAVNGLDNFLITAPYVFAFVSELNKITINRDGMVSVYTRTQEGSTQSDNVFVSRICKNKESTPINILTIKDDLLMLAIEIKQYNRENYISPYDEYLPRLFCDFPLLGTHDFSFPVVINSRRFDPNEPRNGILLYGGESEQNKNILKNACSLYVSLIDYFIQNNYKDIHNAVHLPSITNKDWIDRTWYEENITSLLKSSISQFQMFTMVDNSKQPLIDEWEIPNVFLSRDDTKEIREAVWQLSSQLFPHKHICYPDIDKWYNSLWEECRNYGVLELITEVEKIGSLSELSKVIPNAVEWLNKLYVLIYDICSENHEIIRRPNKIFPNQNGEFCLITELNADSGIDEVYKNAATLISIDFRAMLLDKGIPPRDLKPMTFYDAAIQMINRAQERDLNPAEFYKIIIGAQKGEFSKQAEFIKLYNFLFPNIPIIKSSTSNYNERLLNYALEYWSHKLCQCISECTCLSNFISKYSSITTDNAEKWLSSFIAYLELIDKTDLLDKYEIIPNQNGDFRCKSQLYRDSDSLPDFVKDVCRVAGTDFRDDLASNNLDVSKIISRKKGYKEASMIITQYVRNHMNNIRVSAKDKESFNLTYKWLRDNKDDPNIKQHFSELLDHLYWFYNDDEISESVTKANELDNILNKYGFSDVSQLEKVLSHKSLEHSSCLPIEELLARYGISTQDELQRLIDNHILGEEFLHASESSFDKFEYVQKIIQRAVDNVRKYLAKIGYDLSYSAEIHKTIFTATINGREIYIIARPSDYNEVIIYYDAEFDALDYTKDFELWIDNGKSTPEKLTFGKILKLTGVNRIPLRRIEQ